MALTKQVYLKQKQWFKKNKLDYISGVKCFTSINDYDDLVLKVTIKEKLYFLYFNKYTKKLEKCDDKHKLFKAIIKNPGEFVNVFLRI